MNQNMIDVRNVSKTFTLHQQGGIVINALSDISFTVHAGECLALHGASGSGKSTMLRTVFGNYLPTKGEVLLRCAQEEIIDIANADPRKIMQIRRYSMSYVSQFLRVIPRVSTLDLVVEPLLEIGVEKAEAEDKAKILLERLHLPKRLWTLAPATFSGGEQQRVNIARGLIRKTPLLLLDEPTASLDGKNRQVVIDLILEAKARSAAIIGIFHDDAAREAVADRCFTMAKQ